MAIMYSNEYGIRDGWVDDMKTKRVGLTVLGAFLVPQYKYVKVGNQNPKNMGSTAVHGWRRRDDDSARDSKPPSRSVSQPEFRIRGSGGDAGLAERSKKTRCRL